MAMVAFVISVIAGIGGHAIECGHRIFRLKRLARDLLKKHLKGACASALLIKEVSANTVGDVALFDGCADALAFDELEREFRHRGDGPSHACCTIRGGDDQDLGAEHVGTGVLDVHACQDGNAEFCLYGIADGAAGDAVTSGVKGGTGDKQIGGFFLDHGEHRFRGELKILVKPGVSANDCRDDFSVIPEIFSESQTGTHGTFALLRGDVRHFFAADLPEELVDVMDNFKFAHSYPPYYRALMRLKPISFVEPVIIWSSASMEPSGRSDPAWPPATVST